MLPVKIGESSSALVWRLEPFSHVKSPNAKGSLAFSGTAGAGAGAASGGVAGGAEAGGASGAAGGAATGAGAAGGTGGVAGGAVDPAGAAGGPAWANAVPSMRAQLASAHSPLQAARDNLYQFMSMDSWCCRGGQMATFAPPKARGANSPIFNLRTNYIL